MTIRPPKIKQRQIIKKQKISEGAFNEGQKLELSTIRKIMNDDLFKDINMVKNQNVSEWKKLIETKDQKL